MCCYELLLPLNIFSRKVASGTVLGSCPAVSGLFLASVKSTLRPERAIPKHCENDRKLF